MDHLEIAMGIEETFDVPFDFEDYQSITVDRDIRVGDLFAKIQQNLEQVRIVKNDIGAMQSFWNRMRLAIFEATDTDLDDIQLSTHLEVLFPKASRTDRWSKLQSATEFNIANLMYPGWVAPVCAGVAIVGCVFEQVQLWRVPVLLNWPIVLIALSVFMLVETWLRVIRLFRRFRNRFPASATTVKELCRIVRTKSFRMLANSPQTELLQVDAHGEQWEQLVTLLAEHLSIDRRLISPDSRLTKDLGAC